MGSFKDVVGHKRCNSIYCRMQLPENRVSQAYIVNGERGSGKEDAGKVICHGTSSVKNGWTGTM